jgi:hypothetical protein
MHVDLGGDAIGDKHVHRRILLKLFLKKQV